MNPITIAELKQRTGADPLEAAVAAQLQQRSEKTTRKGDPFLELLLADAASQFALKVWSNHEQFAEAARLAPGVLLRLDGAWTRNQYGIDSSKWRFRALDDSERSAFLAGDPAAHERQEAGWNLVYETVAGLRDPRLRALGRRFLADFGDRFRRSAAARRNHHARRGGLLEHVAQMMRSAKAICAAYPELNEDLLLAGVLLHDCGKLWENNYPEEGFVQTPALHGEMLGHIALGIEVVNKIWRELFDGDESREWLAVEPPSDEVRLHLLHLIASHHGELQFGSPVVPRTPEAFALHYLDNLDAKLEMTRTAYQTAPECSPGVFERQFPLPANLVQPLPPCAETPELPPDPDRLL